MRLLLFGMGVSLLGVAMTLAQPENPNAQNGSERRYDYAELTKAPEKARSHRNPFAEDETAVAGGKKLFEQHCADCHGDTAQGGKKAPSLRVAEVQDATPGMLFWLLTNGVVRRGMPVWSKLPEAQRWQLVRYLQTLKMDLPADPSAKAAAK